MGRLNAEGIKVSCDFEKLPQILCRPRAINQVFFNLLENARAALKPDVEGQRPDAHIRVALSRFGDEAKVVVQDNGVGIPSARLDRIFEPGLTTQGGKIGAGLGLAISWQIVQQHYGRIEVQSEAGQGSLFEVYLPLGGVDGSVDLCALPSARPGPMGSSVE